MKNFGVWHDHESFFARKKYADNVTGAYYANRLALTEYLDKIKKQGSCVVFREVRPEYYAPLGVGILREASRDAFRGSVERFNLLNDALDCIAGRLRIGLDYFTRKSLILKDFGKQRKVWEFI
jgi:DNA repair protein NreA